MMEDRIRARLAELQAQQQAVRDQLRVLQVQLTEYVRFLAASDGAVQALTDLLQPIDTP